MFRNFTIKVIGQAGFGFLQTINGAAIDSFHTLVIIMHS